MIIFVTWAGSAPLPVNGRYSQVTSPLWLIMISQSRLRALVIFRI